MVSHPIDDVDIDNINKFSLFKRERLHIHKAISSGDDKEITRVRIVTCFT